MSVAAAGGGNDDNGGCERKKWKGISEIPDWPPSIDEDTDHDDDGKEGESKAKRRSSLDNMSSLKQALPLKRSRSWTEILGIKNPKRLAKRNPIAKRSRLGIAHKPLQGGATSNLTQASSKPANVPDHRQNKDEDEEEDNTEGSGDKNEEGDGK